MYDLVVGTIGPAMTTTLTNKFPVSLDAYSIQIRFRDSDISALNLKEPELSALGIDVTTIATSTVIRPTSGSLITSSLTPAPTTPIATTSGLSQGAKVAIAVVIPTVLISLCVGVFFHFRRRKKKSMVGQNLQPGLKSPEFPETAVESGGTGRHETDGRIIDPQWFELDSTQLVEGNQSSI